MNRFKTFVTKDIQWKILALILASLLWFVCINITNPTITERTTVPLEIIGMDKLEAERKMLLNASSLEGKSINVEVRGKTSDVANLSDKITAYIDLGVFELLSAAQDGTQQWTNVKVEKTGSFDFDIISPMPKVDVIIDRHMSAYKRVSFNPIGTVAEGYIYTNVTIDPPTVQISGPSNQILKVSTVSVAVDIAGEKEDLTRTGRRIRAFDSDNNEIDVTIEPSTATVTVPISKVAKVPISTPSYFGTPAEGFAVADVDMSLKSLEVMGPEEEVNALSRIRLESINIDGWSKTDSKVFDLREELSDTKLNVVNGTPYECTVTISIEPLVTKIVTIPIENVEKNGYTEGAKIITTEIQVTIEGLQRDIDAAAELVTSLSLSGLKAGSNKVAVTIEPVKGVLVKSPAPTVEVVVTDSDETNEPADTAEGE